MPRTCMTGRAIYLPMGFQIGSALRYDYDSWSRTVPKARRAGSLPKGSQGPFATFHHLTPAFERYLPHGTLLAHKAAAAEKKKTNHETNSHLPP